jgi:uncharacterized membrane protein
MQTPAEKIHKINHAMMLLIIAAIGWVVPGGGYALLGETRRAFIVFIVIAVTFIIGIYVGSIGVVDPVTDGMGIMGKLNPWYLAQVLNSPAVLLIGKATAAGAYQVYGKPQEIGQLYTSISGLLNLLCIINCVSTAHLGQGRRREKC